jgi:autoinducer 2-degrading protein
MTRQGIAMYIINVDIHVKADKIEEFITASRRNAERSRFEPGNLRFDIAVAEDNPQRFLFYEVYHSKDDFAKHQQTSHYHAWRAAVTDLMEKPRVGLRYHSIAPEALEAW